MEGVLTGVEGACGRGVDGGWRVHVEGVLLSHSICFRFHLDRMASAWLCVVKSGKVNSDTWLAAGFAC